MDSDHIPHDTIYRILTKWAWVALGIVVLASISLSIYVPDVSTRPRDRLLITLKDLLVDFVPVLLIAVVIDPLLKAIATIRERQSRQLVVSEIRESIRKELEPLYRDAARAVPRALVAYYAQYDHLPWAELLSKAESVELAVLYCSADWLGANKPHFATFLERGKGLQLYLPAPVRYESRFQTQAEVSEATTRRILRTVLQFRQQATEAHVNTLRIRQLGKGLNHFVARIIERDRTLFIYSPLRNNPAEVEHQPPAIVLDEGLLVPEMRNFVDDDRIYLDGAIEYPDLEKSRYLTWDGRRVVVSISLSCQLECDFCYVKSIVRDATEYASPHFGRVLAYSVIEDPRFVPGPGGTQILIGGFGEPFDPSALADSVEFINTIGRRCDNYFHIATRSSEVSQIFEKLEPRKRIVFNYSLSSLDRDRLGGPKEVRRRFEDARTLVTANMHVALYLRPVVPNRTLDDVEEIAELAAAAGIRHVTVGGLYIDDAARDRLRMTGVDDSALVPTKKALMLDPSGAFRKVHNSVREEVAHAFQNKGFRVFLSSSEITKHFAQGRCSGPCLQSRTQSR